MSNRLSWRTLQGLQAATILVHDVSPPRDRGMTCSNVSCEDGNGSPQYWHLKRERDPLRHPHVVTDRDHRRQPHLDRWAAHPLVVLRDDGHVLLEYRRDRVL